MIVVLGFGDAVIVVAFAPAPAMHRGRLGAVVTLLTELAAVVLGANLGAGSVARTVPRLYIDERTGSTIIPEIEMTGDLEASVAVRTTIR